MNRIIIVLVFLFSSVAVQSQTPKERYVSTYDTLTSTLDGSQPIDFKRAVFMVEDSYLEGKLDYKAYETTIKLYKSLCEQLVLSRVLKYEGVDKKPSWSPYNYVMNNPVIFIDPDGRSVDWFENKITGDVYYNSEYKKGDESKIKGEGWEHMGENGMFSDGTLLTSDVAIITGNADIASSVSLEQDGGMLKGEGQVSSEDDNSRVKKVYSSKYIHKDLFLNRTIILSNYSDPVYGKAQSLGPSYSLRNQSWTTRKDIYGQYPLGKKIGCIIKTLERILPWNSAYETVIKKKLNK